jgi:hypothetical protein
LWKSAHAQAQRKRSPAHRRGRSRSDVCTNTPTGRAAGMSLKSSLNARRQTLESLTSQQRQRPRKSILVRRSSHTHDQHLAFSRPPVHPAHRNARAVPSLSSSITAKLGRFYACSLLRACRAQFCVVFSAAPNHAARFELCLLSTRAGLVSLRRPTDIPIATQRCYQPPLAQTRSLPSWRSVP